MRREDEANKPKLETLNEKTPAERTVSSTQSSYSTKDDPIVSLFSLKKPAYVRVADSIADIPQARLIPVDEFAAAENFVWIEGIYVHQSMQKLFNLPPLEIEKLVIFENAKSFLAEEKKVHGAKELSNYDELVSFCSKLKLDLTQSLHDEYKSEQKKIELTTTKPKKFVIVNMSGDIGRGLVLAHNSKDVDKNDTLTFYAAHLRRKNHTGFSKYQMAVEPHPLLVGDNECEFDACHYGNLSRYIQHAPTPDDLDKFYTFTKKPAKPVATANTEIVQTIMQGIPVARVVALKKMKPLEMVFFNYSIQYFLEHEITPLLIHTDGTLVDQDLYYFKGILLAFNIDGELNLSTVTRESIWETLQPGSFSMTLLRGKTKETLISFSDYHEACTNNPEVIFDASQPKEKECAKNIYTKLSAYLQEQTSKATDANTKFIYQAKTILWQALYASYEKKDALSQQKRSYLLLLQDAVRWQGPKNAETVSQNINDILKKPEMKNFFFEHLRPVYMGLIGALAEYRKSVVQTQQESALAKTPTKSV